MFADLSVGDSLGPYRLHELLGQGSTGTVFRATHDTGAVVSLKLLRAELAASARYTARFQRELRIAREVVHQNVVPVLDGGTVDGRPFLAMRYVDGRSLDAHIREAGPFSLDEVLRLAADVGSGLVALHERGLLHRDVKPSNVLLDERGNALLTDFGLAKGPAYTVLTRPGELLGTPDYLAPELIEGVCASPASDLYAFGCLVYACAAGSPPFTSENVLEIAVAHLSAEPPDLAAVRPDLPAAFGDAVLSALAKDPADRPTSGKAYARALWRASAVV
jgi:serine/threonine-protein kinase